MGTIRRILLLLFLVASILLAGSGKARASQTVAHAYVALRALEQASPEVKAIVGEANLDAYLAGSAGPDIAMLTYYVQLYLEWDPPGLEAHYVRTGQLIRNMYDLASNDRERAFVLGWLTHWATDITIHPLVNRYGGYYAVDQIRHKVLEQFECAHVFNRWATSDDLDLYIINAAAVPARLVNAAYAKTYPVGWTTGRFSRNWSYYTMTDLFSTVPLIKSIPSFERWLPSGAENIRIFSQAAVQNQRNEIFGFWGSLAMHKAFPTPPPTEWEYKLLMDPINIKNVEWDEPDRESGETIGHIVVTYEVNDLRLVKAFADDWDKLMPVAITASANRINELVSDPSFTPPDWHLEWGPDRYDQNKPEHSWPGFPEIKYLLVNVSASDRSGKPLRVLVPPVEDDLVWSTWGEWVPCPVAWEKYSGLWDGYTYLEGEKVPIWRGPAGRTVLKIPVDVPDPGSLNVTLTLTMAEMNQQNAEYYRKPYGQEPDGIHDTWTGVLGLAETMLTITPGEIPGGEAGKKYTFQLKAEDVPEEVGNVYFEWDFGDMGTWSKGESRAISVIRGSAEFSISHTYPAGKSACTITALLRDLSTDQILAQAEAWISFSNVTIEGSKQIVYSLVGDATEIIHDFVAVAEPAGTYRFDWDFGDGNTFSEVRQPGQRSQASHTYRGLKAGDRFSPTVRLYSPDGKQFLAEDAITIRVEDQETDTTFECDVRYGLNIDYSKLRLIEQEDHHGYYYIYYVNELDFRHGLEKVYYDSSQSLLLEKRCWYKGAQHGLWEIWHQNGVKRKEIHYYQTWKDHPDSHYGQIQDSEELYLVIEWYDTGQKWIEVMMRGGDMITWTEWNRDGSVKSQR